MSAGVYKITAPSGRIYIGSAVNFDSRWRVHRHHLRKGTHHSPPLQAAWHKYGEDLKFERLLICAPEHAVMYEQIVIDALRPQMNVCPVAGSTLGYRHTDEVKAKFSQRLRRQYTPEQRAEQSRKMRRPLAPEHAAATRARAELRRGTKLEEGTKEKIRQALKGRINTPDQIARQKAAFAATIARRRLGVVDVP